MTDGVRDPRGPAKRPDPLTPEQVTEIIRRCLSAGRVIPSKHFRSQEFLRDYTIQDAISVLRWGRCLLGPQNGMISFGNGHIGLMGRISKAMSSVSSLELERAMIAWCL